MFESDLIVESARPKPIISYDSIVYPFDTYVWIFTFACIMAQFFLLQIMQALWCKVSGTSNQIDFICEGIQKQCQESSEKSIFKSWFSDFFLSTELIPRRRNNKWINRRGFGIRKTLILKWIVLGSVLTMGYKSTLLSTLITNRYNKPISTLADLHSSGLPLLIPKSTMCHWAVKSDPRSIMKQIYNKTILYKFSYDVEEIVKKNNNM